jgi:HEAT repeat protein
MADQIDQWRFELRSPDLTARREAAEQFAASPEASRIGCLELLEAVNDSDDDVREWVSEALEGMGAPDAAVLPALIRRLEDADADRGYWAATLIGRLGPDGSQATAGLSDALRDHTSLATRERAAWALGKIGPAAKSALPTLHSVIQEGVPRLSKLAAAAIESIDPK